jgi:putative peptidoglycan lipid II flippase
MDSTAPVQSANRQIARAAGTVMAVAIFSGLLGVVYEILVAPTFGVGINMDSYVAASRVPELLFTLLAGGPLASAFVPIFTGFLSREDRAGAWKLASAVTNLVLLALIGVSIVVGVFAPQVVRYGLYVLDPSSTIGQLDLTVNLLRILLITVAIFGVSGLVMGILNSHQIFLEPAIAPAMYSLGLILGTTVLAKPWGIYGLAAGAVLGALLHLLVQVPALLRLKERHYFVTLGMDFPAVGQVVRLMLPRLFGAAVVQLNFFVSTIIALSLVNGSVSSITYAWTLMMMPEMAIAQSIAVASLPTFSRQVARGQPEEMRSSLAAALRVVLLLALPASLGLILLRRPLIALIYQRGLFTTQSTEMVAWALLWYAAGLVGHSLVEVVSRAFYALHDTRTPVIVGAAAMSLNIVFSLAFARLFTYWGWMPHGGLALANSLATALEMSALLVLMRRRLHGLAGRQLGAALWQAALAALAMGLAVQGWLYLAAQMHLMESPALLAHIHSLWLATHMSQVVSLGGGLLIGVVVYALVIYLLRVPELRSLMAILKARIPHRTL